MDDPIVLHDGRPTRSDAVKNRELLLQTAARLFAMQGIDDVTMSAIAEEAGVGKGTLYRHFPNKTALCLALLDHHQRDLQERTLAYLRRTISPDEKLLWFINAVLDFVLNNLGLLPIGFEGESLLRHAAHRWWRQTIRGLLAQIDAAHVDIDYAADTLFVMLDPTVINYQVRVGGFDRARIMAGLIGVLAALVPAAFSLIPNLGRWRERSPRVLLAIQVFVFLIIFFGRQPLLETLANQQLREALNAPNESAAQTAFESARTLGADVPAALHTALDGFLTEPIRAEDAARVLWTARLYRKFAPPTDVVTSAQGAATHLDAAVSGGQSVRAERAASVLAALDTTLATSVAYQLDNRGVEAYANNRLPEARVALESVVEIDTQLDSARPPTAKSSTYYHLGLTYEALNLLEDALTAYRAGLVLNPPDSSAAYALSSLLLIEFPKDLARLQEAVRVAEAGRIPLTPFCSGTHNLADDVVFRSVWECFGLLVTEAGARLARLESGESETRRVIVGLAQQAVDLAEANGQFRQRGYFSAEAYYVLAKAAPETDSLQCEWLDRVIETHDATNERHRAWVAYANEQKRLLGCP